MYAMSVNCYMCFRVYVRNGTYTSVHFCCSSCFLHVSCVIHRADQVLTLSIKVTIQLFRPFVLFMFNTYFFFCVANSVARTSHFWFIDVQGTIVPLWIFILYGNKIYGFFFVCFTSMAVKLPFRNFMYINTLPI